MPAKKDIPTQILLSKDEKRMMQYLLKKKGSTRSEIMRQLIREEYKRERGK